MPLPGAEWLNRVTFDIFCHIVWFLDVQSVSTLASTCEAFQEAITGSKTLWLRTLRVLAFEQSVSLSCFEHLTSVSDLRMAATRYLRMRASLVDHHLPIALRIEPLFLDHSDIFDDTGLVTFMPLRLLPGGRWLLSLASDHMSSYVICWDVLQRKVATDHDATSSNSLHYLLQPAALLALKGLHVQRICGSWAQIQATSDADGAIIAVCAFREDVGTRVHQIIQLDWQDSTNGLVPYFTLRAGLDDLSKYLPDAENDPYTLDGDYLVIDSIHAIFIWNWRDDTICTMADLSGSEWSDDTGFLFTVRPPFLDIFPDGLARMATIPIPPLIPRTSTPKTGVEPTLANVFYHPFLQYPPRIAKLVSLNQWQPAKLRPNIDILVPVHGGESFIIHFSSAEDARVGQITPLSPPSPQWSSQAGDIFESISISSINLVRLGGNADAVVCEILSNGNKFEVKVHAFPQHADGCFSPSHSSSRTFATGEQALGWSPGSVTAGPMCTISGSVLLANTGGWGTLHPVDSIEIAIAIFD